VSATREESGGAGVRTVAVTGSASGIGAATRERLVADGHRVIGIDLRDADVTVDLGTVDGRRGAIAEVESRCGGAIDGLVTCAGIGGFPGRPASLLASVNYFGTVELMAGLRPLLAAGRNPAAVAISSNSVTCQPNVPLALVDTLLGGDEPAARLLADEVGPINTYPATKIAIARWVRHEGPGPEWAGAGITLNAVAPGFTETALTAEGRADPTIGPLLEQFPIPVGRPGRPEEIAALIAFLLGPDARFICGSLIFVDGGTDALLRPDDIPPPWILPS